MPKEIKILVTVVEDLEEIRTNKDFNTKFEVIENLIEYGGLHLLNNKYSIEEIE